MPGGGGLTGAVSAVEGDGRTRVVIDLFRPASFETRSEGNRLIVTVAGGALAGTAAVAANPQDLSKRVPTGLAISNLDFRRGDDGAGRLVLTFDGEGAMAEGGGKADSVAAILVRNGVVIPEQAGALSAQLLVLKAHLERLPDDQILSGRLDWPGAAA